MRKQQLWRTWARPGRPALGVAYAAYVREFLLQDPTAVDYVEVPFELLRHNSAVFAIAELKPVLLHCASLSMAGSVPCDRRTVGEIGEWIRRTGTPWLGEHLSFITAERPPGGPGEPDVYNVGYTMSPAMNEVTVKRVVDAHRRYSERFGLQVLLENPPIYFHSPGSTLSQSEFIRTICSRSGAGLLLDLTHFYISSRHLGFDPLRELASLPLERVTEVHVSGVDRQAGMYWDNHAARAPEAVHALLAKVLKRAPVRAVTLEYNWSSGFPRSVLAEELARAKAAIKAAA